MVTSKVSYIIHDFQGKLELGKEKNSDLLFLFPSLNFSDLWKSIQLLNIYPRFQMDSLAIIQMVSFILLLLYVI